MIGLHPVTAETKSLLWELLQQHLAYIAPFYGDQPDENGIFPYRYFEPYFYEEGRFPYLIEADEKIVGFAMVNRWSETGESVDFALAEFYILPEFRRRGYAARSAAALFARHKGRWQVKYHAENRPAASLWNKLAKPYAPSLTTLADGDEVLSFST